MTDAQESARKPVRPSEFQAKLIAKNERLQELGLLPLSQEEMCAARLYTGPLFVKYNLVLRGVPDASREWVKERLEELCQNNRCVTITPALPPCITAT